MIVILLFNLLFMSMSSYRGVRRTCVQMPMLRGSRGGFFGFRNTGYGKSSACWLGLQRAPSCSLNDQYVGLQYSAKRGLQRVLRTPSSLWIWQGSLKLFRLRGPCLGIQVLGLAIDNQTRQHNYW